MNIASLCILTILAMFMSGPHCFAQEAQEVPTSCELSSSYLDSLLEKVKTDDILIVIARLGRRESRADLNRRRLFNLRTYLASFRGRTLFTTTPEALVTGIGVRSSGLGVLELYLQGKLIARLYVGHNRDLYVGECAVDLDLYNEPCGMDSQKIFYPCRLK